MMRAVLLKGFGPASNMYIGKTVKPVVDSQKVLVKVQATAVNRADLVQRVGKYPPPPGESEILGLEAAGIVEDPGCSNFKKGDVVMGLLPGGGYAEYVSVPHQLLMPVSPQLSIEEAAAIPEVFLTAHQLLHFVTKAQPTDNILIHAAASGVGTAAIQLARLLHSKNPSSNAHIIATSTTASKLPKCGELGATDLVCTKDANWADQVLAATDMKGVDVILDCVGASYFEDNIKCAASDARWVNFAFMGGHKLKDFDMRKMFAKRLNLSFSTLRSRDLAYRAALVNSFSSEVLYKMNNVGSVRGVVDKVFDWEDVVAAHEYVEANKNVGKVVLRVNHEK
eukprot:GDKJ01038673.1.p1 GENE.GDKJ01038673.1~~GDKJ01038673.1.p1  ORF type:complete len:338 (-),score=102.40 GDKJ01038673.1:237-1250(-)